MHSPLSYLLRPYGLVFLVCFVIQSCENDVSQKVTIATAANAQFAINELVDTFTNQTDIECDIIVSSSGKLTAQISEGAPYDGRYEIPRITTRQR